MIDSFWGLCKAPDKASFGVNILLMAYEEPAKYVPSRVSKKHWARYWISDNASHYLTEDFLAGRCGHLGHPWPVQVSTHRSHTSFLLV